MSAEKREEVKRKNLVLGKVWMERMIREGTYGEYRQRLNARRREQLAEKKRALGVDGWLPLDWAESEPEEEDSVQTIRANALEQMDQYL